MRFFFQSSLVVITCWLTACTGDGSGSWEVGAGPDDADGSDRDPVPDASRSREDGTVLDHGVIEGGPGIDAADAHSDVPALPAEILPCNQGYKANVFDPVRAGGRPAGATILGLASPDETMILGPGAVHNGDVYLFNRAVLKVTGGGATTKLNGGVYLTDAAAFRVNGADLSFGATYNGQYATIATEDAVYSVLDSRLSLGTVPNLIHPLMMCGRAAGEVRRTDLTTGTPGWHVPFVMDRSHFEIDAASGQFELTLADGGSAVIKDVKTGVVGTYFTMNGDFGNTPIVVPANPTRPIVFAPGAFGRQMSVSITNSNAFYGMWVSPGTRFVLKDTTSALFLTFEGGGSASNLAAGVFPQKILTTSSHKIELQNSTVPILNTYFEKKPGIFSLVNSTIGEMNCWAPAPSTCNVTGVTVDGSGGYLGIGGGSRLNFKSGVVTTYVQAKAKSVGHFTYSFFQPSAARPVIFIEALEDALVALEGCAVNPAVELRYQGNGAVAEGNIYSPAFNGNATGVVNVAGVARVLSASTSPNAFVSYTLSYNAVGSTARSIIATRSTPVNGSGTLAAWDTTGLAPGAYELHLVVTGASGPLLHDLHPITIP